MRFSRQEYWSGLSFPSQGDLPDPGIEPESPALEADALTSDPPGKPFSHTVPNVCFTHRRWLPHLLQRLDAQRRRTCGAPDHLVYSAPRTPWASLQWLPSQADSPAVPSSPRFPWKKNPACPLPRTPGPSHRRPGRRAPGSGSSSPAPGRPHTPRLLISSGSGSTSATWCSSSSGAGSPRTLRPAAGRSRPQPSSSAGPARTAGSSPTTSG